MAIERNTIALDTHSGRIQGKLVNYQLVLSATLPNVNVQSIVEVRLSASAKGNFYYSVVESTGGMVELLPSSRVITGASGWVTIETTGIFEAAKFQDMKFQGLLKKGDVAGDYTIYNLSIIAQIV